MQITEVCQQSGTKYSQVCVCGTLYELRELDMLHGNKKIESFEIRAAAFLPQNRASDWEDPKPIMDFFSFPRTIKSVLLKAAA